MKEKIWFILKFFLAIFIIYAGVQHFIDPDKYIPFVPSFLPFIFAIIYCSGLIEILLGLALFFKKQAYRGAWGIFILMLLFLPIHVWDVFSETPAIGGHDAALIRLPLQFLILFITWGVKNSISNHKHLS
tara:strand:+ start:65 stop:454 length:390 start_codon:yes stop_codon:yes gene_type:complete